MAAIILINFALQSTFWPQFSIMGVMPDTALVLIVSYAILRGDIEGALFGFFTGLVHDMLAAMFIGVFALLGFLTGYVCGKPFRDFFKDNYFMPFFVVVAVSLVHQFGFYVMAIMLTGQLDFSHYVRSIMLPTTVYTATVAIPIYAVMHFINTRITRHEANFKSLFGGGADDE